MITSSVVCYAVVTAPQDPIRISSKAKSTTTSSMKAWGRAKRSSTRLSIPWLAHSESRLCLRSTSNGAWQPVATLCAYRTALEAEAKANGDGVGVLLLVDVPDLEDEPGMILQPSGPLIAAFRILVDHHHVEAIGGLRVQRLAQPLDQYARIGGARQVFQASDDLGNGAYARFGLSAGVAVDEGSKVYGNNLVLRLTSPAIIRWMEAQARSKILAN